MQNNWNNKSQRSLIYYIITEPADVTKFEVDTDEDGRVDEKRFSSMDEPMYSIKLLYSRKGRLVRETWYDKSGEITSDYGPGFRMYNYDKNGRLVLVSNHFSNGDLAEVFGVAQVRFGYDNRGKIIGKYYGADGFLITIVKNRAASLDLNQ